MDFFNGFIGDTKACLQQFYKQSVHLNYRICNQNMFPKQTGRISFFQKGAINCLPMHRGCITQVVNFGARTFFLEDRWLNGQAPIFQWLDVFRDNQHHSNTLADWLICLRRTLSQIFLIPYHIGTILHRIGWMTETRNDGLS